MDIDIHTIGRYFEINKIIGLHIGAYEVLIARHHRLMEIGMAHIATVDKEVLACIASACALRQAYVSRNLAYGYGSLDRYDVVLNITAEQGTYALLERLTRQLVFECIVVYQGEGYISIHQGQAFEFM